VPVNRSRLSSGASIVAAARSPHLLDEPTKFDDVASFCRKKQIVQH
jgi:hypothetical protein